MEAVLATNRLSFLVHFLQCSSTVDSVPLQKATRLCPQIPVLLLSHSQGIVKARCCVPEVRHCLAFHICLRNSNSCISSHNIWVSKMTVLGLIHGRSFGYFSSLTCLE
jgi:hypothetical protein